MPRGIATGWLAVFPRFPPVAEALPDTALLLMFINIMIIPCPPLAETLPDTALLLMFTNITIILCPPLAEALPDAALLLKFTNFTVKILSTSALVVSRGHHVSL
jgi:hypothetical protein